MLHQIISMDPGSRASLKILVKHQIQGRDMALYFPKPELKHPLSKVHLQTQREISGVRSSMI